MSMKNKQRCYRHGLVLVASMIVLTGCTTYRIGAVFEDGGQPYFGEAMVMIGDGGSLTLTSEDGTVECKGVTQATARPSMYSTVGGRGHAEGKCSDGRTFKVDFVQTRARGGSGRGIASDGSIVKVYFDASEDVVRSQLQLDRLNSLVK